MKFIHAERSQNYANRALAAVDPTHAAAVAGFGVCVVCGAAEFSRHRFCYIDYFDSATGRFGEGKHAGKRRWDA